MAGVHWIHSVSCNARILLAASPQVFIYELWYRGTLPNFRIPRDPSTFSEGDWRHCYVGLEGGTWILGYRNEFKFALSAAPGQPKMASSV